MRVLLFTDGGVRTGGKKGDSGGHDGRAAIGYVIRKYAVEKKERKAPILDHGNFDLGRATVNEAEYSGLILGLHACAELGATHVHVRMDSQLVINQMSGLWACKEQRLKSYIQEAQLVAEQFIEVSYEWIPRELNQYADQLVREILG